MDAPLKSTFSFKFIPKKKNVRNDGNKKVISTLVKGICLKIDEEYKIKIDASVLKPYITDKSNPDFLLLDFTEESYEIKGLTTVFDIKPNERGNYTRYIRSESYAKFFPGSKEKYVPFCNNWVCSGYIVRRNGKLMFKFNECIAPQGYETFTPDEDD